MKRLPAFAIFAAFSLALVACDDNLPPPLPDNGNSASSSSNGGDGITPPEPEGIEAPK